MSEPPLPSRSREAVLTALEASGLEGRGGGFFPVHRKWRAVIAERDADAQSAVVVANGGEGEPGSLKDRVALRTRPDAIISGLRLAIDTVGAGHGIVYLKGSFREEERSVLGAIERAGLVGRVRVHRGDDTYVGGEETALLESIEGRKAWPRPKPPRPAAVGLHSQPTLIHNVDTLSRIEDAIAGGPRYRETTTLAVTLWGDVNRPGVYEAARNRSFASVVAREGGGASGEAALLFPNGAHAEPLEVNPSASTRGMATWEAAVDPEALRAAGLGLGTASIFVLDASSCVVSVIHSIARFFARESCGQCPPCVLGSTNLLALLTGASGSDRRLTPDGAIAETASFMAMHGYCGHSPAAARIVPALFRRFRDHVGAHLAMVQVGVGGGDSCPEGLRMRDPFAPGSPELDRLERAALGSAEGAVA